MRRVEWLNKMRVQAEALYDHLSPVYWIKFGLYANTTHRQFIEKFLGRVGAQSILLDAACGAGRYDGMLLEAGHAVFGIDQSNSMLVRAREMFPKERFPGLQYAKMGLQEIDFQAKFDGAICVDAMEHVCPEDWPGILARFQKALKPGGVLYITVEVAEWDEVNEAFERAKAQGLPVVYGEVVAEIDAAFAETAMLDLEVIRGEHADLAVYHYYPSTEQVHAWFDQAGLAIEDEGTGDGYVHLLARKNT